MKLYNLFYRMLGVKYGKNLKLQGLPVIVHKKRGSIEFGKDVSIKSSFLSNLIGLYQRSVIVARTNEARIKIGDDVGMSGITIYARDSISIGSHCRIGANTKIFDNDFHPLEVEARNQNDFSKLETRRVKIGDNVFIGCNCIILKGTKLGDEIIVGYNCLLSGQEIPNKSVVVTKSVLDVRRIQ